MNGMAALGAFYGAAEVCNRIVDSGTKADAPTKYAKLGGAIAKLISNKELAKATLEAKSFLDVCAFPNRIKDIGTQTLNESKKLDKQKKNFSYLGAALKISATILFAHLSYRNFKQFFATKNLFFDKKSLMNGADFNWWARTAYMVDFGSKVHTWCNVQPQQGKENEPRMGVAKTLFDVLTYQSKVGSGNKLIEAYLCPKEQFQAYSTAIGTSIGIIQGWVYPK